jgi:hemoglobin/transferrin/lactoferrin receptor protein
MLVCTAVAGVAGAADPALKAVVVTATRAEAEADTVPATVTTLNREQLDRRLAADGADLFADDPDVAMPRDLRRHGATRVNIRGIEDNRVVQMVDGVRLPDHYNGGGPTNFTLSATPTAMPDFLKRIEIVRGASSSLYGSDAIGGVVGFVTLDPADLLGADASHAFRYRATYTGANHGQTHTVLGALRGDVAELLLGYSQGRGDAFDNHGEVGGTSPIRTRPNPQDLREKGMLAKLVLRPAAGHKLTATLEGRDQAVDTTVMRSAASLPRVAWMQGDDNSRRMRGSVEWEHKPAAGFYDRLTARVYAQNSDTTNNNFQRRSATNAGCSAVRGGAENCYIEQDFFFDQDTRGASLQAEKVMDAGTLTHLLTFGIDLSRVSVKELRDGRVWRNGAGPTNSLAGETYPLRDFAIGRTDTVGLFVQDEISGLAGDRLTLMPGIRYDRTRLKPDVDPLAQQVLDMLGRSAVKQTSDAFSPKLGAIWKLDDTLAAYGQVARGFRAPNYNEVNGSFRNASQRYSTVPNPDLKPETSIGIEAGLRHASSTLRMQVAVFDNRYKNFIDLVQLACPGNPACYHPEPGWRTNMSVNLSRVRIYGAELRGAWAFAPGWRVDGGIAYAHGTDRDTDQPLNSIEPTRLSLALVRDAGAWGAEARLRAASRKSRTDDTDGEWFHTPGYGTVDIAAWRQLGKNVRATLALNNLLDKKYWLWSDIRQADARNPAGVDFYSQPGRSVSVAIQADF